MASRQTMALVQCVSRALAASAGVMSLVMIMQRLCLAQYLEAGTVVRESKGGYAMVRDAKGGDAKGGDAKVGDTKV